MNNLNNPQEIWRYSFNNQIEYPDRCLLITLFTFQIGVFEDNLIQAFENRLNYEKNEHNQIINSNQFNDSIKILLNGFIKSVMINSLGNQREYILINPSLTDFLIGYISESFQERKSIISSIKYIEQLNRFNPANTGHALEKDLQIIIRDKIAENKIDFIDDGSEHFNENLRHATFLEVLCKYCQHINIDNLLLGHLKQINLNKMNWLVFEKLEYMLLNHGDSPLLINYIKTNFIRIVEGMMSSSRELENAKIIPILFEKYDYKFEDYTSSDNGFKTTISMIDNILKYNEANLSYERKDEVMDLDGVMDIYNEIDDLENDLKSELFPNIPVHYDFGIRMDNEYWEEIIEENNIRATKEELQNEIDEDYFKEMMYEQDEEDRTIDDLFYRSS